MGAEEKSTPPIISLVSGGIAGGVEAAATYPFEFAKTRVQLISERGYRPPRNPYSIVINVYRNEGLKALYKGCGSLVLGSVAKDAVRFLSFDTIKNAFKDPETGTLTPGRNMLAGMAAGVFASICAVTPSERLKTALIDDARHDRRYTSALHAIRTIIRDDGMKGMYRGFAGTTLKQASATSFRMGSYNIIKDFEVTRNIPQNTAMNFLNGAASGTITTLLSQPFDTIKTRSQSAKATTTVEAVRGIWSDGGIRAFWRGTVMRLSRTVFSGGVLFTTVEAVSKVLTPLYERRVAVL
ncbi:Tricarboxylate transport [Hyphodiscus hymeniophilus]|uniref:Tricarboxylate transport n=1 Tax=Hyphodiscus hymeniophilus TaxID=353542 RepID=A0A9P6SK99_9HELO|nr:Tricarboxylate transport [Hyphodiscus hymeniophilus]